MEKAVHLLRAPAALIDRGKREDRLPPGTGLLIAFGLSFACYATIIVALT